MAASYIERFEWYDEPKRKLSHRCLAWRKSFLCVHATARPQTQATAQGRLGDGHEGWNSTGRRSAWRYEGLTMFLPVYERLEDELQVRGMSTPGER